ncbi:MAG: hypothetical protein ACJAR9_001959, partial [Celeribacter sp.]
ADLYGDKPYGDKRLRLKMRIKLPRCQMLGRLGLWAR